MARQFFIIFGCLAIGEFIVWLTGIKLPSSIIGMLALTALLKFNIVELSWVQKLSEFLISNLGFFFVPPGVAIMLYLDLIQKEFIPIIMATVISTISVLIATGQAHQLVIKIERMIIKNKILQTRKQRRNKKEE
ncbi:MAG: CidA/LrgA family protein [Prevotella sp.]